jgi:hypothetical protein
LSLNELITYSSLSRLGVVPVYLHLEYTRVPGIW